MSESAASLRPADAPASIYGPDGRPQFFQDPAMDRFVAVLLNVTSELWVQTERLANIEAALAEKGSLTADDLRAISTRTEIGVRRDTEAKAFLDRVLAPLREPAP
jgi:hypothetical protein